jgi:hypothetical protein
MPDGKEEPTMPKLFVLAGIAGLFLAAGCAPVSLTKADVEGRIVCNDQQMNQAERQARKINASVQWVNCPQMVLRTS